MAASRARSDGNTMSIVWHMRNQCIFWCTAVDNNVTIEMPAVESSYRECNEQNDAHRRDKHSRCVHSFAFSYARTPDCVCTCIRDLRRYKKIIVERCKTSRFAHWHCANEFSSVGENSKYKTAKSAFNLHEKLDPATSLMRDEISVFLCVDNYSDN